MLLNIFSSIGNFFKSIFGTFDGLIKFFTFLQTNWIGLTAGAFVALIIIVLIGVVLKGMPNGWLCALVILLCCGIGLGINAIFTSKKPTVKPNVPANVATLDDLTTGMNENWPATNGGFTFEQIQNSKKDAQCPTADDIVLNINCQDYGDYVAFYYFDGNEYQSIVFMKTSNGLVLDGVLNYSANFDFHPGPWWTLRTATPDIESFKWYSYKNEKPSYWWSNKNEKRDQSKFLNHYYNNYVSASANNQSFLMDNLILTYRSYEARQKANAEAKKLTYLNACNYFVKFNNSVEIVNIYSDQKDAKTRKLEYNYLNSFYNHIYSQVNSLEYGKNKVVDLSTIACLPIPEDLQKNYPLSDELKALDLFKGKENFAVYNCKIGVNCYFEDGQEKIKKSGDSQSFEDDTKNEEVTKVTPYNPGNSYSTLALQFKNIGEEDLTGLDLEQTPVVLQIKGSNSDFEKTIKIDSLAKLNQLTTCLIEQSQSYSWQIQSGEVIFEGYSGSFTTATATNYALTFNYKYLQKRVMAQIGLNPIGTIDKTKIDLATFPVKIILTNETKTYQFVFDSNDKLDKKLPLLMELGEYNWEIKSSQLTFTQYSGKLTLTTTDNIMMFNYTYEIHNNLKIAVTNQKKDDSADFIFKFNLSSIGDSLIEKFGNNVAFAIYIYNSQDKIVAKKQSESIYLPKAKVFGVTMELRTGLVKDVKYKYYLVISNLNKQETSNFIDLIVDNSEINCFTLSVTY